MRVTIEPPRRDWRIAGGAPAARTGLAELARRRSGAAPRTDRLIATGHQAWLWHPGILAKYLAGAAAARDMGADLLNVVVDHDPAEALRLDVPFERDGRLRLHTLRLGEYRPDLPPVLQPPVDADAAVRTLDAAAERLGEGAAQWLASLRAVWPELPSGEALADQVARVLHRLMEPMTGAIPWVRASDLLTLPAAGELVERMTREARRCARCYNRAVAEHPRAGIRPLMEGLDAVELPLWALTGAGRARVYADAGSSDRPALFADDPTAEAPGAADAPLRLAPRALFLTALMRSRFCDLFIHGKGGGVYDRITEEWWREWTGEELAPMAVVSADLTLDFDAPLAGAADVERATWWAHHLPHNLDRRLVLRGPLPQRKRELLRHMDDDRDRERRAAAFREVHAINDALAREHPEPLREAQDRLEAARIGLANRAVASRRDWCFALYPREKLERLRAALE